MAERVIAEQANGAYTLREPEALCRADYKLVRDGERYELRVTVELTEAIARKLHRYLTGMGRGIPEAEAFDEPGEGAT